MEILHSHSALEREMRMPKNLVLVDIEHERLFSGISELTKRVKCDNGITYLQVPTSVFVKRGGVFKNYNK